MRFLQVDGHDKVALTEDLDNNLPPYAILSHTWGADGDEVTFDDLTLQSYHSKPGYSKIRFCSNQAKKDNLENFWVDTCCINKKDQNEFSKSINSMFRWYRNAERCYVYLSDVSHYPDNNHRNGDSEPKRSWKPDFRKSRWFTRGWTLQELIAPPSVEFFSREGERLGNKETLEQLIAEITGLPITALRGTPLSRFTLDERIKWSAKRNTKNAEDKVYCLFGIFNIYLPVFYGEGEKALERLKEEFDRSIRSRRDLGRMLYLPGAVFDSGDIIHTPCHTSTRIDLLDQIRTWTCDPQGESIFWLSGMAGTGKSTISLTIAKWLAEQGRHGVVDLGASFFFKRGEGDRGNFKRFFLSVARSLGLLVPGMDHEIANEITTDPTVYHKTLSEQFDKLIYRPLQKANLITGTCPVLVVVADAIDECENDREIRIVLNLWSQLSRLKTVSLRLFLTSRPELPIRLGFNSMPPEIYRHMVLEDAVSQATVQQDITRVLTDSFSTIREEYNSDNPGEIHLAHDWPGEHVLQYLVYMTMPLFITVATVCRYVADHTWDPREQLQKILQLQSTGDLKQMEWTYLPVVRHLRDTFDDPNDEQRLHQEFRVVVGTIIMLTEPLSATALATLLGVPLTTITNRLRPLHSVLQIPDSPKVPIRPLHESFSEFLQSDRNRAEPFSINGQTAHTHIFKKCLELLSGRIGLRENICSLQYPGQQRYELSPTTLDENLPPALQYACRYWIYHVERSMIPLHDEDDVHVFLQKHFLHWIEAMSLMGVSNETMSLLGSLVTVVAVNNSGKLQALLADTQRIVLANQQAVDIAPLQIYSSALIFAPQNSLLRKLFSTRPGWLRNRPVTPQTWGSELQTLEGHEDFILAVAFSCDGSLLASSSADHTVRLWNTQTGQTVQILEGHEGSVGGITFSSDDALLASCSLDGTVRLWDVQTGEIMCTLQGHTHAVTGVAFSHKDSRLLASASEDQTVRLWDFHTGDTVQLRGHTSGVGAVAFSYDHTLLASGSADKTVRLWDIHTGKTVRTLMGHTRPVTTVAFSHQHTLLASGSIDSTMRLWDPQNGQMVRLIRGDIHSVVNAVAFSPDDTMLASGSYEIFGSDHTIQLWDPRTGQELRRLTGHISWVGAIAFSQDGTMLASGSRDLTIRLWDPRIKEAWSSLERHPAPVTTMTFSPNGTLLASGCGELLPRHDQTVKLWDTRTGQALQTLQCHNDYIIKLMFSGNGKLLASHTIDGAMDRTIRVWDPFTGQVVQTLHIPTGRAKASAFTHDSTIIALGLKDSRILLLDPRTADIIQTLKGHAEEITTVAFSRDDSILASGSADQTVRLWNPHTGQMMWILQGHTDEVITVVFARDGSLLASGSKDQTIWLWDPLAGQAVHLLRGHTAEVTAIAFSHDGLLVASCSRDQTTRLWDRHTGILLQTFQGGKFAKTIEFSKHDTTIITDTGVIPITLDNGNTGAQRPFGRNSITVKDEWIQQGGQNLLWLPHEYQGLSHTFHRSRLAIGHFSGRVSFMEFEGVE